MSLFLEFMQNVAIASGVGLAAGAVLAVIWFFVMLADHLQIEGRDGAAWAVLLVPCVLVAALVMTVGGAT